MAEQLISVGFGKETFTTISHSLAAFSVSDGFIRETVGKAHKRQGQVQRFPASAYPEINGCLYLDSVRVPDGAIILLQSSHKARSMPLRDGAILIAIRATGPMLSIHANLPACPGSLHSNGFLAFQGRGDILSEEDFEAHGISPNKNWCNGFLDEEEVAECFTVTVMSPELEGKKTFDVVEDRSGNTVRVLRKPARKLSLRRA